MPIRMTHPEHGVTFAVGAEVDWNKQNGWIEQAAQKKQPEPPPEPAVENPILAEIDTFKSYAKKKHALKG